MQVKKLRDIRGIGATIEEKLLSTFETEDEAIEALRNFRISEISSIEGIGEKFSLQLCRRLYTQETGERMEDFLHNADAVKLYDRLIRIISGFASTNFSKSRLLSHYPLGSRNIDKIIERQELSKESLAIIDEIERSPHTITEFDTLLRRITPLKKSSKFYDTASRVIMTADKRVYNNLEKNNISNHVETLLIESPEDLPELIKGYDEVLWVGSDIYIGDNYPNVIALSEGKINDPINVIPEYVLAFFAKNKTSLMSISQLSKLLLDLSDDTKRKLCKDLDLNVLSELQDSLKDLGNDGEPINDVNKEYQRIAETYESFDVHLSEVQLFLNERLEEKLQETTVKLGGEKLVEMLRGLSDEGVTGAGDFRHYLDEELSLIVEEEIEKAEEELIKRLKLDTDEIDYITGIFPREIQFPIDPVDEIVSRMKEYLRQKKSALAFEIKVSLAKTLQNYQKEAEKALQVMFELDYRLMLGKFTKAFNLVLPKIVRGDKTGLIIKDSRNLFLIEEEKRGNLVVEPVSYALGEIGVWNDKANGERIILLSGANSGGKTTLLVSIAIIVILAQMGLPVPCSDATIGCFDEIHFYRKSTGQMDAGAFETTLKTLSNMLLSESKRLILADEMESISEPGASARVIGAILSILGESEHTCGVFVSHLAKEIAKYAKNVRIDGIEAKGLSENLELIVSRTPILNYYAKSTPELIVQRLHHISSGREKEIYKAILDTFNSHI